MIGDAVVLLTVAPPDRARRPDHLLRQGGRPTRLPCRHRARLAVGDKALAVARVPPIDQPVHRGGLPRLTQHGPPLPRPRLAQPALWPVGASGPLTGLRLPTATRRDHGPRRVVPPLAARCLDNHHGGALENAAPAPAEDVSPTPPSPAPARPQHHWRPLRTRCPESRRHGQDEMTVHDALVEPPASLAAPVVAIDFGAAQVQGCRTAHGAPMGALAPRQTPVGARAHLLGGTAGKPLGDEARLRRAIVPRMDALTSVPVIGQALFEDAPGRRGCCSQHGAPSWGGGRFAMPLCYPISPAPSTLSSAISEACSPPFFTCEPWGLQGS